MVRALSALPMGLMIVLTAAFALSFAVAGRAVADSGPLDADHVWPVTGPLGGRQPPPLVRGFEPPPHPWSPGHRGVDLAAVPGAPVRAVAAGRVVFAGTVAGQGVVSVELTGSGPPALRYTYEPVRSRVRAGEAVVAGQPVGTLAPGPFHCPDGCLHWGLLRGDDYLDPLSLLPASARRLGPSRLLPLHGIAPPGQDRPGTPAPAVVADGVSRVGAASVGTVALGVGVGWRTLGRLGRRGQERRRGCVRSGVRGRRWALRVRRPAGQRWTFRRRERPRAAPSRPRPG